jgi:hypothetical protein
MATRSWSVKDQWIIASLMVLCLTVICIDKAWTAASTPKQTPILRGPVFISVIYPAVELKWDRIELIEPIRDGYAFWGKIIMSAQRDKGFFPGPISYPYRFRKSHLNTFLTELRGISLVDSRSNHIKAFPNIPKDQQQYSPSELTQILQGETYISFRLKQWKEVEFMAFPTFLVMTFNYVKTTVNSHQDFQEVKKTFHSVVDEFRKMGELQSILGISRGNNPWTNVPIIVFTAINWYNRNVLDKIHGRGLIAPDEARRLFLQNVSLLNIKEIDNSDPIVTHCEEFSSEMPSLSVWRFYYAALPLFHEGDFGDRVDPFHFFGPRGVQSRILRTALFINVTLPSLVSLSKNLQMELTQRLNNVREIRMQLSNEFSDRIQGSNTENGVTHSKR